MAHGSIYAFGAHMALFAVSVNWGLPVAFIFAIITTGILEMLMERPGFVVTTNQLLSHVWGWDSEVDVSVVWVHISNLRKKLAALKAPVAIRFVRNAGYTLEQEA